MDIPKISERRHNSLHVKSELIKELSNKVYESEKKHWDSIKIVIEKELAEKIDRKLISEDDMKEVIWTAQSSGDKFIDQSDRSITACLVRRILTYWVRYKVLPDGTFEILDAYYHRLRFEQDGEHGNQ